MSTHDPLEDLTTPVERQQPRPSFARSLRARLAAELGIDPDHPPTVQLPERKAMSTTTSAPPTTAVTTPYLTVHDGAAAIAWYVEAFGAVEEFRVVGDDGTIGHAELTVGTARFMLSDEYPDMDVVSPRTAGGTTVAIHLEVDDVDALYAGAIEAGATALREPEDQPHGARHGTLLDPFGHRWMLSQQIETLSLDEYADRSEGSGYTVERGPESATESPPHDAVGGAIWAALNFADAPAGIRFMTEVLGFEEQIVVPDEADPSIIVHSQLRWPEGGVVQAASAGRQHSPFSERPTGTESLYIVTSDPMAVWERCQAAAVEVIHPPEEPDYAPGTVGFSIRDPEGNLFSFGSYGGET